MKNINCIKIIFPVDRKDFASRFIKLFTGGNSSHVEVLLNTNGKTITADIKNNVHYNNIIRYLKKNVELELFEFVFEIPEEKRIILDRYIETQIGKKYDRSGSIKSVFGWFFQYENRLFCSELTLKIIKMVFMLMDIKEFENINPSKTNPTELKKLIKNSKYLRAK